MSAEPWDELLDTIDRLATSTGSEPAIEQTFAALVTRAIERGDVDAELHVDDTARWLRAMLVAHRTTRDTHPDVAADDDLAVLRLIVTRWLHPHRLDQRDPRS